MFAVLVKSRQAIMGGWGEIGEDVGSRALVFAAIALLLFPGVEIVLGERLHRLFSNRSRSMEFIDAVAVRGRVVVSGDVKGGRLFVRGSFGGRTGCSLAWQGPDMLSLMSNPFIQDRRVFSEKGHKFA